MIELGNLQSTLRERLSGLLGPGLLMLAAAGLVVFAFSQILPAVRNRAELASQLEQVRQTLSRQMEEKPEAALQAQLAKSQAMLAEQAGYFLSESEVATILNHLYRYAEASGVQIVRLEAQSAPKRETPEAAAHDIQTFRLKVNGLTPQLIDFVSRLQEASLPGVAIDQLTIERGQVKGEMDTLTMDLLLYISPDSE
ncbi:MAG: hypothetical protein AAB658_18925 [Chloroflexota bacterium]